MTSDDGTLKFKELPQDTTKTLPPFFFLSLYKHISTPLHVKKSGGFRPITEKPLITYKILLVPEQKWQQLKTIIVGAYNDY